LASTGDRRGAYRILLRRPERKIPLARSRRKWEEDIKMDLQEEGWGVDWIGQAQDRNRWWALVNAVMILRVQQNGGNF
jgi:hypothetical protein